MYDFVSDSDYTFAIFWLITYLTLDFCFEGATFATAIYRKRLHPYFTVSRFLSLRFRSTVVSIFMAIALQMIANLYPETFAFTLPADRLLFYKLILGGLISSILFGIAFSFAGLSRFSSRTPKA